MAYGVALAESTEVSKVLEKAPPTPSVAVCVMAVGPVPSVIDTFPLGARVPAVSVPDSVTDAVPYEIVWEAGTLNVGVELPTSIAIVADVKPDAAAVMVGEPPLTSL